MSEQVPNFALGLNAWLRGNAKKVPMEDLICCLPKVFRENYVVAHSSISAQASHYHNPRVIMFDFKRKIYLSISGGDEPGPRRHCGEYHRNRHYPSRLR